MSFQEDHERLALAWRDLKDAVWEEVSKPLVWMWSFLPDKCQIPGCCRKGVRGNENVYTKLTLTDLMGRSIEVEHVVACDYCSARFQKWPIGGVKIMMTQKVDHAIEEPDAIVKVVTVSDCPGDIMEVCPEASCPPCVKAEEVRPEPPPPPPPPPPRER